MERPERLTVPTCVACRAMRLPGSCELGCGAEERLDLVGADVHDELEALAAASLTRAAALRAAVRPLTGPPAGDAQAAYRALQDACRAVLREQAEPPRLPEPAGVVTTWWCPSCGGVDAPQPCLGICVWRPAEWVVASRHEAARAAAQSALDEERALRALVRRAALVTPRTGEWERGWAALADAAAMR